MLWTSVATQFKATANGAVNRTTNAFQKIKIVGLSWLLDLLNLVAFKSSTFQFYQVPTSSCWNLWQLPSNSNPLKGWESSIPFLVPALTRATHDLLGNSVFQAGFSNKNAPATRGPRIQVLVPYCMQAVCCQDLGGNTFWILISQILWLVNLPPPP